MSTPMKFESTPHILQFEAGGDYPATRTNRVFQVRDRTAGGQLKVETLGIQNKTRVLVFNLMSKVDYTALIDWFLNVVNGGEVDFEFTDEYGDTGTVKITDNILDFTETSLERYSGTLNLEYV